MPHVSCLFSCSWFSSRFVSPQDLSSTALTVTKAIDAPSFVWASEVFPTTLRAKGVSLAVFAYFAGTITFSTPAPVELNSM